MSFYGWRQQTTRQNSVELEASLAPAEAEVGAVAKADQNEDFLRKQWDKGSKLSLIAALNIFSYFKHLTNIWLVFDTTIGLTD